jgi:peptide deformylase
MALLEILHYPDPRLRKVAQPVAQVDDAIRALIDNMLETMYAAPGIGLAATQVNSGKRIVVIDVSEDNSNPLCLINPEILEIRGSEEMEEGCLSVPGFYEMVQRADWVRARALDRDGREFVDYLSQMKRMRIRKKLEKQERQGVSGKPEQPGQRAI